jgi:16S rRNA processing protein RimM
VLEVGRITKPHGVLGEVLVQLVTTESSRLAAGSVLVGDGRELTVVSAKAHKDRWIVRFEGMRSREDADALRGLALHADAIDDDRDPEAFWVHELIGAEVVDTAGSSHGPVVSVEDNPASDILVLESGRLVPLTFVTRWLERPTRLEIDPPEGLFDL